ncbi:glycosyl hydrolase family 79 C-terminal domain-containing protein [Silvibacterium dinghuense]|uniref:Beta-glucuronidase C-terminal domain-containing protein n=1 Tax=Silvibacterium dinghuense TaxID=1560006 RepID=A0A4Q1SAX3_9BACT|nr:glycosyl hydrolase family 79 C-terminal domain-containing protein [Silvibacterium dinghuense]RXS93832.1 hypothetical protein ESZ00_17485 [Silvibacterium dinghuense]GGH08070.1 hypothetical protein GCM10011586_25440 [Silvibacterium dinghuense]
MRRRDFLRLSLSVSAATAVSPSLFAAPGNGRTSAPGNVRLSLSPDRSAGTIGRDFTGLSYESAQLGDPEFFSADNKALVGLFRRLGGADGRQSGVLRIGGNTSENSHWKADGQAATDAASAPVGPDTGKKLPRLTAITPQAIDNLHGFLEATGWGLIYGLNLATGTPEVAADEAEYVWKSCGKRVIAFQIGNEADIFHQNGLRKPDYGEPEFAAEWQKYFDVLRKRLPEARFAGPDTAYRTDWMLPFARAFQKDLVLLTEHYYAEGPPTDPSMTIDRLLGPNSKLQAELATAQQARKETGVPFRLSETNSCYSGGKEGVSNTFAAALWTAELMYQVAATGGVGINFHGGGYGWYTPIAGTREKGFSVRPGYYGMLLFAQAGAGELIETKLEPESPLVSAYGLRGEDGAVKVVLFNKSTDAVEIDLDLGRKSSGLNALYLTGPSLAATDGMTLGGAAVSGDGGWEPSAPEVLPVRGRRAVLTLPAASAILVTAES